MFSRGVVAGLCAVLAAGFFAVLAGCEWFQSSDPSLRSSPRISSLNIQPSSVPCEKVFQVSFRYEDPQGDLASARVSFQQVGGTLQREETPAWPDYVSRSSGTVSFPFDFKPKPCTDLGGTWTVTVQAEDDQGHTSNTLTGQVVLSGAG